jgi:hypothetical protein
MKLWRATTDDDLRLFLGWFKTEAEALKAVDRYSFGKKFRQKLSKT